MPTLIREIVSGTSDPLIGDISGWKGVELRSFEINGRGFVDLLLSPESVSAIDRDRRADLLKRGIAFNRIRVATSRTIEVGELRTSFSDRHVYSLQKKWYELAGSDEDDPTKRDSDAAAPTFSVDARRNFLLGMLGLGVASVVLIAALDECGSGGGGYYIGNTWYRGGGGGYG